MKLILLAIALTLHFHFAESALPGDSVKTTQSRKSNMRLTSRVHNVGLFNFSGRMASTNPALDANFNYDRKAWSAMVFTAVDLYDRRSDNNFTLALLYKRFQLGKRLSITPNVGFVIEGFGDAIGDRLIVITSYRLTQRLIVDNTSIIANIIEGRDHDWVNRWRFMYAATKHVDVTFSLWHNNKIIDRADYLSTGLNVFYNRIRLSKNTLGSVGVSGLVMAETSDEIACPKKNGLMLTLAVTVD
jgi:hypothetical protein